MLHALGECIFRSIIRTLCDRVGAIRVDGIVSLQVPVSIVSGLNDESAHWATPACWKVVHGKVG